MILRLYICAILQFCIIGLSFGTVPQITRLNVQCDRTGMKVNVEFDNAFNGIIFSKGHFSDPNCRYVDVADGRKMYEFFISSTRCGSIGTDLQRSNGPQGFKNIIIIQNDPEYQEIWDSARKLSCDWVNRLEKTVTFAPFGVDMLGIQELRFPGDTVDCWMDIQRGHGPFAPAISGVVPIGEKLTVVIYVRDSDGSFDVHVKDCYAYDTPDYRNPNAHAIKLTDERGCPLKEKLVQGFYRTRDVRNSGATIIAYGLINAFKFPEKMDVYLACNVEVCKGGCLENTCQPEVSIAGDDSLNDSMMIGGGGIPPPTTTPTSTADNGSEETEGEKETSTEKPSDEEEEESDNNGKKPETPKDVEEEEESSNGTEGESDDSEKTTNMTEDDEENGGGDTNGDKTDNGDDKEEMESSKENGDSNGSTEEEKTNTDGENGNEEESNKEKSENGVEKSSEDEEIDEESDDDKANGGNDSDNNNEKGTKGGDDKEKDEKVDDNDEEEGEEERKKRKISSNLRSKAQKSSSVLKNKSKKLKTKRPLSTSSKLKSKKKENALALSKKPSTAKVIKKVNKQPSAKLIGKSSNSNSKSKSKSGKILKSRTSTKRTKQTKRAVSNRPSKQPIRKRLIRASSPLVNVNNGIIQSGRHIRTRRSVVVQTTNATFAPMMHSIQIISPIEDFDEKELNVWEKMMQLEGRVEIEDLDNIDNGDDPKSKAITRSKHLSSYCFSHVHLITAFILLVSTTVILSMILYMICSYLYFKHYPSRTMEEKISYLSYT